MKAQQKQNKKRTGPQPSQHGMNMNSKDTFGDPSSYYFQNTQNRFERRMNPASQYPQYPQMQNQMGYASGNKPLNPLENYPMMDPMGNSMIDPAMLQH